MKIKKIALFLLLGLAVYLNNNYCFAEENEYDVGKPQEYIDSEGNKCELWITDDGSLSYVWGIKEGTALKELIIPDSVKRGGWEGINYAKAEKIFIPSTVENMMFDYNETAEFIVDKDNLVYSSVDGIIYTKDMKSIVGYPKHKKNKIFKLPNTVEDIKVSWYYNSDERNLGNIILPSSLKKINLHVISPEINLYIPSEVNCISEEDWNAYFDNYASNIDLDEPKVVYTENDSPYIDMFNSNST